MIKFPTIQMKKWNDKSALKTLADAIEGKQCKPGEKWKLNLNIFNREPLDTNRINVSNKI